MAKPRRELETTFVSPHRSGETLHADPTYRRLLGSAAWMRLAPEIRRRFSVRPGPFRAIGYSGTMHVVHLSFAGWLFAQFCRLFGTPLAPRRGFDIPMKIRLYRNDALDGTTWERDYDFSPRSHFVVSSTKYCDENGRLCEYLGNGFSMRLTVVERNRSLVFESDGYYVRIPGTRLRIPDWLTPGRTVVVHEQIDGDRFRFCLSVDHPVLGCTIFQDGEFYSEVRER